MTSMEQQSAQTRYHGLDGLRAVMMLLGLVLHAIISYMHVPPFGGVWELLEIVMFMRDRSRLAVGRSRNCPDLVCNIRRRISPRRHRRTSVPEHRVLVSRNVGKSYCRKRCALGNVRSTSKLLQPFLRTHPA